MKKKFKIKTIEDIALQFIKHNEPSKKDTIGSNDTIVDSKYYVKKYIKSKNSESILSQSFEKLIQCENNQNDDSNNKVKLIKFYKVPQKVLGDEDICLFESMTGSEKSINNNSKIMSQKALSLISNGEINLREIKPIKNSKKLFFNIHYDNAYEIITEMYLPLLNNLESISSLKAMTDNIMSRIEFFCSHSSIFELDEENTLNNNNNISETMEALKIFELIELSLILFILHIILEVKIEYIDNFLNLPIMKKF